MCPSPLTDSPKTATAGGFDPVPPTAAPPASGETDPVVGDVNGDGVSDILVAEEIEEQRFAASRAAWCAPVTQAWKPYYFISTTIDLNPPASGGGYGLGGSDGGIFAFGNAYYRGSLPGSATGLGIANRLTDEDTDDANSLSGRFDRRNNGTITDTGHSRARVR
jgi:hypothetical protein